jgi:transcriptional regulator with XRE-family HTH domain
VTLSTKFIERVEKTRKSKGLTQVEIAKRMGVKQQSAAYYLQGKGIDLDVADQLARAVEEPLDQLLFPVREGQHSLEDCYRRVGEALFRGIQPAQKEHDDPPGDTPAQSAKPGLRDVDVPGLADLVQDLKKIGQRDAAEFVEMFRGILDPDLAESSLNQGKVPKKPKKGDAG